MTRFRVGGLVRVSKGMCSQGVEVRSAIEMDVIGIAVYIWWGRLREFRTRGCAPEVEAIVTCIIEEVKCVFEAMVVYISRGGILLG
jgi:hypothetical protein